MIVHKNKGKKNLFLQKTTDLAPKDIIKLLVVEDSKILLDSISEMLNNEPDFNIVASLLNCGNILEKINETKPDIILLDMGCTCNNSLNFVQLIKKNIPGIKLIIMDIIPSQDNVIDYIQIGVSGFILKSATISEFNNTIRSVARGETVLPSNMAENLFSQIAGKTSNGINGFNAGKPLQSIHLTKREQEVVDLVSRGLSNKEIGMKLHLSPHTIKSHVRSLLKKMSLKNRFQIAIYAGSNPEMLSNTSDEITATDE